MIDVAVLRHQPGLLEASLRRRGLAVDVAELGALDAKRREVRAGAEDLRAQQKEVGKNIANLEGEERQRAIESAGELAEQYKASLAEADDLDAAFNAQWTVLPNLTDPTAADGLTDEDSVELSVVGDPPAGDWMKDHVDLGEQHGFLDIERAAKLSGSRFGALLGPMVRLELALVQYALDHLEPHGFVPVAPPVLVREQALFGTGFFPSDREQVYAIEADDLYLVGTSEVSIAGMFADEIFDADTLPQRYVGFSSCFRREAGTYGKDTRGIFRVHQFDKVEMFSFCEPERSREEHDFLLEREEELAQGLEIPYRVVNVAAGDLGASAAKKYDIEAWFPGQGRYREITSTSNTTDYQSRRLKIRYRSDEGNKFVHTLNGTAIAVGRWLIAIVENHQQRDGSITVPEALLPYVAFDRIGG
ncbi:MAG TPA: serine--tRNA ligase [Acidimicrobiia bacterium]|nr:serine--tRNA ligase [Acidimicrobiia bacterium]